MRDRDKTGGAGLGNGRPVNWDEITPLVMLAVASRWVNWSLNFRRLLVQQFGNPSKEEARQNIERCEREVAISDRAHLLVENAIKALMQLNGVDRDTAERAIRDVMGGA